MGGNGGFSRATHGNDIVAINSFYNPWPWLRDADDRIVGFRVPVYFVSGKIDKGVFVSGTIKVTINILQPSPKGGFDRQLVREWILDEQQAAGYRVRKRSIMGNYYGFVLKWPPDADVMGRRIELAFKYQRPDGRVIASPPRQLKVPLPPGFPAPRERLMTPPVQQSTSNTTPAAEPATKTEPQ